MKLEEELDLLQELLRMTELDDLDPQRITYPRGFIVEQYRAADAR